MKKLLEFILENIIGKDNFSVSEEEKDNFVALTINVKPESMGLVIGKEGRVIKSIRNILRVKATLEKKGFSVNIVE